MRVLRSFAPSIRPLCSSPWSCIARDIDSEDSERRHFGNQIAEGGPIKIGEPADVGHGGVVAKPIAETGNVFGRKDNNRPRVP